MNNLQIIAPEWAKTGSIRVWHALFKVKSADNVRMITIESRSSIELVVSKLLDCTMFGDITKYYISSPNFGVAIPCIGSLSETHWITEHLIGAGMPTPDAVTTAQVLREIGDF